MKTLTCQHADDCSQPNRYWRIREYAEHVDGDLKIIENILPDPVTYTFNDQWACTECGEPARVKQDEKPKGKHKVKQEAML